MTNASDVVVIGGGTNGLIAAAYLVRGGLDVTVLEELAVPGGCLSTVEATLPGFRHDLAASFHLDIQVNPILSVDELGLMSDHGLRYVADESAMVVQRTDGLADAVPRGVEATVAAIAEYSAADADAYREMIADWHDVLGTYVRRLSGPPGTVADDSPEAGAKLDRLSAPSGVSAIYARFAHDRTRELMLAPSLVLPIHLPGTGFLPINFAGMLSQFSMPQAAGGSRALADSLVSFIEANGGSVLCERPVEKILVEDGRATAVITGDGERYDAARAVVSGAHATQLAGLLGPGHLPDELETLSARWRAGGSLLVVHMALPRTPVFRTTSGSKPAVKAIFGTTAGMTEQHEHVANGRWPGPGRWMQSICASFVDPSRAPEGQATLKLITPAPYALQNDPAKWAELKERYADELVGVYAEEVDGYSAGDELARLVVSPVDLEGMNRHNRGGIQGGDLTPDQAGRNRPAPGWSGYRMPVAGLYQTGTSTYPHGGVNGWSGRNAARAVLDDVGIDPDSFMAPAGAAETLSTRRPI